MAATAAGAAVLTWSLHGAAAFALMGGRPQEAGPLTGIPTTENLANAWVHAAGALGERAVEYRRPLESDRFRLAPAANNPGLWEELRIPAGIEPDRYVAPSSFVGRLVPLADAGLQRHGLEAAILSLTGAPASPGAWVLLDGEAPSTSRWALGLATLFATFAIFNVWGVASLLRPVRSD
jgi:hypothetical protein